MTSENGSAGKKPLCAEPWRNLYIGNSGVYQPCCHIQFQTEKPCGSRDELLDIYNSSELVDLRQQLASHNVTNEECRGCLAGARSNASYTKDIGFEGVSSSYKDARQKAEESFSRGETHVEHLPLLLTVYLSYRCNIRCVMCSQALVRDKSMFRDYPTEALQDIFDEVGNGELPFLNLVGGEPMYSRDGIALLEYFGESEDLNTQLGVTTNGTLFRRHRDLLSKISQANFSVSIDGFGDSYNYIRDGASWDELIENLDLLQGITEQNPKVAVAEILSIVMASSICDLPELIRFFTARGEKIRFLECDGPFYLENCFVYPSLLVGMPWQQTLAEAIEVAEELELTQIITKLEQIQERLLDTFENPSMEIFMAEIHRVKDLFSRKTATWKIGGRKKVRHLEAASLVKIAGQFVAWLDQVNVNHDYLSSEQHTGLRERVLSVGRELVVAPENSLLPIIRS